ncbi:MAG: hypothetical protein K9J76_10810 [Polaromonas sp.]|nr:hypothetical protein [Polaromonas sp.]
MNDIDMTAAEFGAWMDEGIHSLAVLNELDKVLASQEAALQAQEITLTDQLHEAGIGSPKALEQALSNLPIPKVSPAPTPTPSLSQGKRRLVSKVWYTATKGQADSVGLGFMAAA